MTDKRCTFMTRYNRNEFTMGGGMIQLVNGLPDPVKDWLIDNTPEGATMTDTIRAIITDAYFDEQDKKPIDHRKTCL